jgi:hypothetical protein
MGEKRERKRARRQAQLRGETYSPSVVKMIAGTPRDDLGGFFDGETGVREPRPRETPGEDSDLRNRRYRRVAAASSGACGPERTRSVARRDSLTPSRN